MEPTTNRERILLALYKHRITNAPTMALAYDLKLSRQRVYKILRNCAVRGEVRANRVGTAKRNIEWEILRQGWRRLEKRGIIP
jgi:hypothetical protein